MEKIALEGGKPTSKHKIPIAKPIFDEKTINDIADVLRSGYVRQGPKTKEFEDKFREATGAKYAYAVSSGTAALHTSYLSFLKPGDEVIVPAFTFFATASTVLYSNGRPVFADSNPDTFLIDIEDVKEKLTNKTLAISPVHLFGNAANLKALNELASDHKLLIVSDTCQAHGTKLRRKDIGSYDDLNCYSFYPTKSMTTGEGGIVTTNNEQLDRLGRLIRSHGDGGRYNHVMLGLNYRMTDIAAAIGLNQLEKLPENLKLRRSHGKYLNEKISKIEGLNPQKREKYVTHSYSYFTLKLEPSEFKCGRDEFLEALRAENIDCAVHYPIPLTKQPAIINMLNPEECPVAEELSKNIFSIPMYPGLGKKELENIIAGLEKVTAHYGK